MQIPIDPEELAFAREVDRLGQQPDLTQDDIAARFGLTKNQVRHRLGKSHLLWAGESRVRCEIGNQRLDEALAHGTYTEAVGHGDAVPV